MQMRAENSFQSGLFDKKAYKKCWSRMCDSYLKFNSQYRGLVCQWWVVWMVILGNFKFTNKLLFMMKWKVWKISNKHKTSSSDIRTLFRWSNIWVGRILFFLPAKNALLSLGFYLTGMIACVGAEKLDNNSKFETKVVKMETKFCRREQFGSNVKL